MKYIAYTCPDYNIDIYKLVDHLTAKANTDAEKVAAFYFWIAFNITYDTEFLEKGINVNEDYYFVLKNRKTICGGYAGLFEELCYLADIDCEIIVGEAYTEYEGRPNTEMHLWNVVKIDNEWKLIDVCWASGYITELGGEFHFVKKKTDIYLFAKPDELIKTHFPNDVHWQLLKKPLTKDEFLILNNLKLN